MVCVFRLHKAAYYDSQFVINLQFFWGELHKVANNSSFISMILMCAKGTGYDVKEHE